MSPEDRNSRKPGSVPSGSGPWRQNARTRLREMVERLRERASSAGLAEEDVRREVETVRRGRYREP